MRVCDFDELVLLDNKGKNTLKIEPREISMDTFGSDYATEIELRGIVRDYDWKPNNFHFEPVHHRIDYSKMYRAMFWEMPKIKDVKFNDPATIVFWADGTKTVVKCQDDDTFDPEKGLAMAISKKALGNKGNYCNVFKKWLPEESTISLSSTKEHTFMLNIDPDMFKDAFKGFKGLTAFGDRKKAYDKGYKDGMFAKECDRDGDCYGCKFDRPHPEDSKRCEGCCRNYADGYVKEDNNEK